MPGAPAPPAPAAPKWGAHHFGAGGASTAQFEHARPAQKNHIEKVADLQKGLRGAAFEPGAFSQLSSAG